MIDVKKAFIYLAGPLYGSGTVGENVRQMVALSDTVDACGMVPFLPHLYFFQDMISPQPREHWLGLDLNWVRRCDGLIRLVGESPGSDAEVALAEGLGMPVLDIGSLLAPACPRDPELWAAVIDSWGRDNWGSE